MTLPRGLVLRAITWTVAALAAVVAHRLAGTDPALAPYRALLVLATLVVGALAGELLDLLWTLVRPAAGRRAHDLRPADGDFQIVPIAGAEGGPNPADPRFRRFDRFASPPIEGSPPSRSLGALEGRIVLVSLFIGHDGTSWSDAEIAATQKALGRAAAWVEREAARWSASVNVDLAETYFASEDLVAEPVVVQFVPEGDHEGPFEANAAANAITSASRAAAMIGFPDAVALLEDVARRITADAVVWLVHPRSAGRSLAIPGDQSPVPGVALAVCYAREASFPEPLDDPPFPDPTTYAHEFLHLFGATDKYKVPLRHFPRDLVTERDVMRLDQRALSRLRVDRLTAAEIGWTSVAVGAKNDPRP